MKENFDCTQFITFDSEDNGEIHGAVDLFASIGFKIIPFKEIREVKKVYFKKYLENNVFELKWDEFLGHFEQWQKIEEAPKPILDFVKVLETIIQSPEVRNFRIMLTSFAEEGLSTNEVIKIKSNKILEGLFLMSSKNFEVWADNLILEIE